MPNFSVDANTKPVKVLYALRRYVREEQSIFIGNGRDVEGKKDHRIEKQSFDLKKPSQPQVFVILRLEIKSIVYQHHT